MASTPPAAGRMLTGRTLPRDEFLAWCAQLPAGYIVAMETSSSSHHWVRKLIGLGLDARIIAAQLVSPYRRQGASGKNDANDAEPGPKQSRGLFVPGEGPCLWRGAACKAQGRPGRLHHRIRGLLAEFGQVFAKDPAALEAVLTDTLEDAGHEMSTVANKSARILWAVMTEGEAFDARRVSAKPGASTPMPAATAA